MAAQAQLEWEARAGRLAAYAAFGSAALLVGAIVIQNVALGAPVRNSVERLGVVGTHSTEMILIAVTQSLALVLLAYVLVYLHRAASYRRPETPTVALVLAIAGPLVLAGAGVVVQVLQLEAASAFLTAGPRTDARAREVQSGGLLSAIAGVGLGASLALGFALVLLCLHSMWAGLLSRFMAILGIIVGALYVLPVFSGPQIIQLFWVVALGLLFLGRWPGGRGPAWETGEAIRWPSTAEQRSEAEGEARAPDRSDKPEGSELESASAAGDGSESSEGKSGARGRRRRQR